MGRSTTRPASSERTSTVRLFSVRPRTVTFSATLLARICWARTRVRALSSTTATFCSLSSATVGWRTSALLSPSCPEISQTTVTSAMTPAVTYVFSHGVSSPRRQERLRKVTHLAADLSFGSRTLTTPPFCLPWQSVGPADRRALEGRHSPFPSSLSNLPMDWPLEGRRFAFPCSLSDLPMDGPLEGRHSAFPNRRQALFLGKCPAARLSARQGRQNAFPPEAQPRTRSAGRDRPVPYERRLVAAVPYHSPTFGIEAQGSAFGSGAPCCRISMEMLSGERTNAMWPSRGGRLMVTPPSISRWHTP